MQLPNIPKFPIGSPVELNKLWKRATVYKSQWHRESNQYIYFLFGEDINPTAPYKESALIAGIPRTPSYQEERDGVIYRIYLGSANGNYAYFLWQDGKFIHEGNYNFLQKSEAWNAALKRLIAILNAQEVK
jgi:sulfur relay (sulfurtransferase) DsrC/TusE family protein